MRIDTTAILRHCMSELNAAYAEAAHEYGDGSIQANAIADAIAWMDEWFAAYIRVDTDRQHTRS